LHMHLEALYNVDGVAKPHALAVPTSNEIMRIPARHRELKERDHLLENIARKGA